MVEERIGEGKKYHYRRVGISAVRGTNDQVQDREGVLGSSQDRSARGHGRYDRQPILLLATDKTTYIDTNILIINN